MRVPYLYKGPSGPDVRKAFPEVKCIYRPEIKIAIQYGTSKQKLFALVDSGADSCLFPKDVADVLAIDLHAGIPIMYTGIGGHQVPFYFHEVEIFLDAYRFKTMACFASAGIGVGAILGQRGFFENFTVAFDYKQNFVEIKERGMLNTP